MRNVLQPNNLDKLIVVDKVEGRSVVDHQVDRPSDHPILPSYSNCPRETENSTRWKEIIYKDCLQQ